MLNLEKEKNNKKIFASYVLKQISANSNNKKTELFFKKNNPWQFLVAVILSAQTTDINVNKVTPKLFENFPNVYSFSNATAEEIIPYIKSLGLFRNKSKNLIKIAKIIVKKWNGFLPSQRVQLESLPGVGPKSAAVIITNIFNQQAIAVDTHVRRIVRRLGLTKQINPSKIESELNKLFNHSLLSEAHNLLIWHGRKICNARNPKCFKCPVERRCPKLIDNF